MKLIDKSITKLSRTNFILDFNNLEKIILSLTCEAHSMIKQRVFVHVGHENISMGCPNLSLKLYKVKASHGYIIKAA